MEVREATEKDIPAIVDLLKVSLGEHLTPKSERYWRWKHLDNPFGSSPVYLSMEGDKITGVRAFMRWEWIGQGNCHRAMRAVDTATHPAHQGKGIFKKLTMTLISSCKEKGDHFVFNTPNKQSKPGYMKMGWEEAGKLPVRISLIRPFHAISNFFFRPNTIDDFLQDPGLSYYLDHPGLPSLLKIHSVKSKNLITKYSKDYLSWRYAQVPVAKYKAIGSHSGSEMNALIIGRIKYGKFGNEFRITDCFLSDEEVPSIVFENFKENLRKWKVDYTTIASTTDVDQRLLNKLTFMSRSGPMVTIRKLAIDDSSPFINFNNWSPSLGDLELF